MTTTVQKKDNHILYYSVILWFLIIPLGLNAQFSKGFNPTEAIKLIALDNSFTFLKIYKTDTAIIPSEYKRIYRSGTIGLDNQYQIWKNSNYAVISFRGSTSNQESWLENLYSAMIPSSGTINIPSIGEVHYKLANDTSAHVHAGWTLGLLFMVNDLTYHIKNLNREGIYTIVFTGHSQGGALTHLARAYFENLPKGVISSKNKFISYAFASPMPGNKAFAKEYNNRFAANNTSYNIINPKDMIPKMPITLHNGRVFDPNEIGELLMNSSFSSATGILASRLVSKWFIKDPNAYYIKKAGIDIEEQIEKKTGKIEMPKYCPDQSYTVLENKIIVGPFEDVTTQLKKDSVNMDSLRAIPFYDNNLKIQAGGVTQHKPFNYYLYLLKEYSPKQYSIMRQRYRVIN